MNNEEHYDSNVFLNWEFAQGIQVENSLVVDKNSKVITYNITSHAYNQSKSKRQSETLKL